MNDDNKNINDTSGSDKEQEEIISEEDENTPRLLSKLREKIKNLETEKKKKFKGRGEERGPFLEF